MTGRLIAAALAGLLVAGALPAAAQTPQAPAARLRVYLDCETCFPEFLREEIRWVDFVRQPQDADVHLLATRSTTGGGGREWVLRFVGAGRFQGVDHELRALSVAEEPEDGQRRAVLRAVTVGLLTYLAHAGLATTVDLSVEPGEAGAAAPAPGDDPWDYWFFSLEGSGSIWAEETTRQVFWRGRFTGDRVTEAWKIGFGVRFDQETRRFNLRDEDDGGPLRVTSSDRSFDVFVAKGLGPHWSAGIEGEIESSTYGNRRFAAAVAPAVEYNVFPYEEYATRQLRIQYQVGLTHVRYHEVTLFDRTKETRWQHAVSATLDQRQPWGSLQAGAEWSQYLHDGSKYRIEVDGEVSIRLARGFSVEFDGSASRIRDQLSIPRRDATPEEVLLELRELLSGYDVSFSVGLTYSFGSLFNNIVNPRFGRR